MTSPAADPMALAEGFDPRTREDWRRLVAQVLAKGRPEGDGPGPEEAEDALRRELDGGLSTAGLYLREDRDLGLPGVAPFTRGRTVRDGTLPWDVRQLHDDPDPARSRAFVLDDLEHGVTSVWLHVGDEGIAAADVPEVLADVRLDLAPVVVSSFTDQEGAARALLDHVGDSTTAGLGLGLDPVSAALRTGAAPDLTGLAPLVDRCVGREGWSALTLDTRVLHDGGASEVDALAFGLSCAVALLRRLEADGLDPARVVPLVEMRLPATADQFLTAAVLRAARRLWARVAEACGVPEADRGLRTHAVTSLRMAARQDPFVNVLRGTLAAFGASIGGADAVTVLPHDTVAGLPERFGRRLARNTQILLADESNVGRVTDPGGGSWYLEALTDEVATAAWERFREVERAGGALEALASGLVHRWAAVAADDRARLVATRARPLTGVSTFPDPRDPTPPRRTRSALPVSDGALAPRRDAAPFEALRDRARALGAPTVTLATLGPLRDHQARRSFAENLLAAGGLVVGEEVGPVAVLVAGRGGYADGAREEVERLRAAGVGHVLVAGRADELGDDADLVDGELYDGVDVVALLGDLLDRFTDATDGAQR
ncbi:methylmalonyl-CoA mutase small subunit [Phycicoccus sp. BSK3Z-2]|uniref:Methylmalonyl-CoA mutase small subunit n=1 Tax=Phycicoccus avicenniae TaxID=2828860 RepID=A0A941I0E9_9MICO|nr:methylmalonyl-CoA mutase family protein [Phycicoccus avicenniae]MBR7743059.1 methylmalonyl-CoA mutase small subunit [Phycicoccus avicenniae]